MEWQIKKFPHILAQLPWDRCEYGFSMLYLTKVDILMITGLEQGLTTSML